MPISQAGSSVATPRHAMQLRDDYIITRAKPTKNANHTHVQHQRFDLHSLLHSNISPPWRTSPITSTSSSSASTSSTSF